MPGLSNRQTQNLLDDLSRQGATIQKRSKSVWRITYPDGSVIVAHSSPSDVNWHRHLQRATEKAGLHWPLENRTAMKKKIKELEGRNIVTEFVTTYGEYNKDYISQESRDKVAAFLSGKGRSTSPQIQAATGLSSPTITRSLLALGWLQESEREKEVFTDNNGLKKAKMNTYWSPAPESVLASVVYRATDKTPRKPVVAKPEPKVRVAPKQTPAEQIDALRGEPVDLEAVMPETVAAANASIAEAVAEPAGVPVRSDEQWFAEAERLERSLTEATERNEALNRAISVYKDEVKRLDDLKDRYLAERDAALRRHDTADQSWAAPGIADLPEGTTITDLFATLRLMGLAPEIRLRRGETA